VKGEDHPDHGHHGSRPGHEAHDHGWATGYNAIAIPLAAGALYTWGVLLTPALGAAFMSLSTVIVAINARLLDKLRLPERGEGGGALGATKP